jgi:hypothetical protein|tara:strand:+ start:135 stop:557 length:423 start_codon:yes stop_codon:yes gene_type:complete
MIKYNLKCHQDHEFESWFSDSQEFEKLNKKGLLECIYCSSKKISKSIMAPMVSNLKKNDKFIGTTHKNFKYDKKNLLKLRRFIERNFDYVGKDFSRKVREVFYDKNSNKAIYGTATPEERKELADEGIDLLSIPWINKDN